MTTPTPEIKPLQEWITDLTLIKRDVKSRLRDNSTSDNSLIESALKAFENKLFLFKDDIKHYQRTTDISLTFYTKQYHEFHHDLVDLRNDYEWRALKHQIRKDPVEDLEDPKEALMTHGLQVQQESKESLGRSLALVHQSIKIGKETLETQRAQEEQLKRWYGQLEDIQTVTERGSQAAKRILRKMAADKAFWGVVGLVLGCIIIILVLKGTGY